MQGGRLYGKHLYYRTEYTQGTSFDRYKYSSFKGKQEKSDFNRKKRKRKNKCFKDFCRTFGVINNYVQLLQKDLKL